MWLYIFYRVPQCVCTVVLLEIDHAFVVVFILSHSVFKINVNNLNQTKNREASPINVTTTMRSITRILQIYV